MATAKWYRDNREQVIAKVRAYAEEHRAEISERGKRYAAANPEKRAANMKRWNAANRERRREYSREWHNAHPGAMKGYVRKWYVRNAARVMDKGRRRRAMLRGVTVEHVELTVLVERDRGRCGVCGLPVRAADASVDHILPVSKGGAHSYANTRLAHLRCNKVRGNRGPAQLRMLP